MSSVSSLAAIWERKIQQSSTKAKEQPKYAFKGNSPTAKASSDKPLERPEKILFRIKQKQRASLQLPQTIIMKPVSTKMSERQQEKIQNRPLYESSQEKSEQTKTKSAAEQDTQGISSQGGDQQETGPSISDPKQEVKMKQVKKTLVQNVVIGQKVPNKQPSPTPNWIVQGKKEKDPDQNIKSVKQLRKQWESIKLQAKETPKGVNQKVGGLFMKQKPNIHEHQSQKNVQVQQSKNKVTRQEPPQQQQKLQSLQYPEVRKTSENDEKKIQEQIIQNAHEQHTGNVDEHEKGEIEDQKVQNQPTLSETLNVLQSEYQQGQLTQKEAHHDTKSKEKSQESNINGEFLEEEPKNQQIQHNNTQQPILETPLLQIIQNQQKPQFILDPPLIEATQEGDETVKKLIQQQQNFTGLQEQHQQLQKGDQNRGYQQVQEELRKNVFIPFSGEARQPNLPEVQIYQTESQDISEEMPYQSTNSQQIKNIVVQGAEEMPHQSTNSQQIKNIVVQGAEEMPHQSTNSQQIKNIVVQGAEEMPHQSTNSQQIKNIVVQGAEEMPHQSTNSQQIKNIVVQGAEEMPHQSTNSQQIKNIVVQGAEDMLNQNLKENQRSKQSGFVNKKPKTKKPLPNFDDL